MKERVQLYLSLYIGCKSWKADLDEFVRLENHEYSSALSEHGKIRKPTAKSDFLKCLYQENGPSGEKVSVKYERPEVDVTAVDGATMVQMNAPKKTKKCGEYSKVKLETKCTLCSLVCNNLTLMFMRRVLAKEKRGKAVARKIV